MMIGRPESHPIKKLIGFSERMIVDVERWRSQQQPVPNLSEAIRSLVELGLASGQVTQPSSAKAAARAPVDPGSQHSAKAIASSVELARKAR